MDYSAYLLSAKNAGHPGHTQQIEEGRSIGRSALIVVTKWRILNSMILPVNVT